MALGNYEEAIKAFEFAYLVQPDFIFAYRDCADALLTLGKFDEALSCLEDLLKVFWSVFGPN